MMKQSLKQIIHELVVEYTASPLWVLLTISTAVSSFAIAFFYQKGFTLAYGDAESHINIAKRVIDSITPGFAQLGGVWLPLPHLLMVPFVAPDFLWQTGIGGTIISGISFVISALFLYKIIFSLTKNKSAAIVGFLLFIFNTNILYMQSTPMSELPLILFFVLSLYFYFQFLQDDSRLYMLIAAGFFGFCATLTRYDGWFLVGFELIGLGIFYYPKGFKNHILEGKAILFGTLGFFGIVLWLLWDQLILGDAFYFTNSPFSAKSQQKGWLLRHELPAYKHVIASFWYYFVTSLENIGVVLFILAICGLGLLLLDKRQKHRGIITLLLIVPFLFYTVTMYLGQSVIFIPDLTPASYQWRLFNVRYGIMMVPTAAICVGFLYSKAWKYLKGVVILAIFLQSSLFLLGFLPTLTLEDGIKGLSAASHPDAQYWLQKHYDGGYVLLDDYARTVSITQSHLPIQNVIYIGNKPYWQHALTHPEKMVRWVVLQKGDVVWNSLYANPAKQAELYTYFSKAYTSPNILIFKRNKKQTSFSSLTRF